MAQGPHVGDVGTTIRVAIVSPAGAAIDLGGAAVAFRFRRPSGEVFAKDANVVGDGSTGQAEYVTTASDLDAAGAWKVQPIVTEPSAVVWRGDIGRFDVEPNL